MEFSRQENWSGLPFTMPEDLPNLGIEPTSLSVLHWQAGSLLLATLEKPLLACNVLRSMPGLGKNFQRCGRMGGE